MHDFWAETFFPGREKEFLPQYGPLVGVGCAMQRDGLLGQKLFFPAGKNRFCPLVMQKVNFLLFIRKSHFQILKVGLVEGGEGERAWLGAG